MIATETDILSAAEVLRCAGEACDEALRQRDEAQAIHDQKQKALDAARAVFSRAQRALLAAADGAEDRWWLNG